MTEKKQVTKKVGVLTSSRADYGIYFPLLKTIEAENSLELKIIAFGAHTQPQYGNTINNILSDGFNVTYRIDSTQGGDDPFDISFTMAETSRLFAGFWNDHKSDFDIVFCLGDRFEMFAAVMAGIPFNIRFAHIHGGEKTLGAIDNVFRHGITLASRYHFVSCPEHARRVSELIESVENVYNVGSLSIENILTFEPLSLAGFNEKYNIDLSKKSILVTFHPETVNPEKNVTYAGIMADTLSKLGNYNIIITLPNADTFGSLIREKFIDLSKKNKNIFQFENLGTSSYLTAMKFCSFLLGNTSSGIIEAASFGKWVINVGDRQKGRCQSGNVFNVPINSKTILDAVAAIEKNPVFTGVNIYQKKDSAKYICDIIKKLV
jgi:GDP/UDP-N,N'-diacetylbacillosamine 2-epimerase (hydrolysing)